MILIKNAAAADQTLNEVCRAPGFDAVQCAAERVSPCIVSRAIDKEGIRGDNRTIFEKSRGETNMLYFENDYCEGAHPAILQKLMETNFEKVSGYGTDPYCASAKEKIRKACDCPEADAYFISGGTQTNAIVIASMLNRWEGVIAAAGRGAA